MNFQKIGILGFGEMGYHWARLLISNGVEVLTCIKERSEETCKRALHAGVNIVSLQELVRKSDLIVSTVVPAAAKQVALDILGILSDLDKKNSFYLDVNSISPMTAKEIGKEFSLRTVKFIDGGIIGSSEKLSQGTIVYVSGPEAEQIMRLEQFGFSVRNLGLDIGLASALKILSAGMNKGLQCLLTEILVSAKSLNLVNELIESYNDRFPGLIPKIGRNIVALPVHAVRRAQEMEELERTFRHYGLQSNMIPAARKVLTDISDLKLGQSSEYGVQEGKLSEIIEQFFENGLLK